MYVLYVANKNYSSWSLRSWVLMRELGIAFREELMPLEPVSSHASFRVFSPSGRVPCLHDGDTVVWDSLAIAEYLAERHAGVWPADATGRAWSRCAAAEMHSGFGALRSLCSMSCGQRVALREYPAPLRADVERVDALWREGLQRFGGPFLGGAAFSAVDAFFCPVAFRAQTYALRFSAESDDYAGRLLRLPAMREWYAAALLEPWREPGHESGIASAGKVTADYRA